MNNKAAITKPTILLDLMASKAIYNGLGQLSLHLSNALVSNYGEEFAFTGLAPTKSYEFFNPSLPMRSMPKLFRKFCPKIVSPYCANNWQYDLWHVTNQNSIYFPLDTNTPVILTIHDLNFIRDSTDQKKISRKLKRLQRRVDRASIITTGSWFAKAEIETHLKVNNKPVLVIYHGSFDITCEALQPSISGLDLQANSSFFFSIGEFLPKKNFSVLLSMLQVMPGEILLIAGKNTTPYGEYIQSMAVELGVDDRVFLLGKISNEEKKWLYENAKAFFFPSINEGFGIPVIEGLTAGLPVFCSNATSLPEVGGGHTFEWDSFEPHSMAQLVQNGLAYFAQNEEFRLAAYDYGKSFTWDKAAQSYASLYRQVLHGLPLDDTSINSQPTRYPASYHASTEKNKVYLNEEW